MCAALRWSPLLIPTTAPLRHTACNTVPEGDEPEANEGQDAKVDGVSKDKLNKAAGKEVGNVGAPLVEFRNDLKSVTATKLCDSLVIFVAAAEHQVMRNKGSNVCEQVCEQVCVCFVETCARGRREERSAWRSHPYLFLSLGSFSLSGCWVAKVQSVNESQRV